jgi:hypothetical protein
MLLGKTARRGGDFNRLVTKIDDVLKTGRDAAGSPIA